MRNIIDLYEASILDIEGQLKVEHPYLDKAKDVFCNYKNYDIENWLDMKLYRAEYTSLALLDEILPKNNGCDEMLLCINKNLRPSHKGVITKATWEIFINFYNPDSTKVMYTTQRITVNVADCANIATLIKKYVAPLFKDIKTLKSFVGNNLKEYK